MSDQREPVDDELAGGVAKEMVRRALGVDPDDEDDDDDDDNEDFEPEPEPEPITPAQLAAVEVLASGGTFSDAARAAGVDRLTVDDWRDDNPAFVAELNARRQDRRDSVQSRLRSLADKAVATIEKMLDDESVPAPVRLKVAQIVLDASVGIPKAEPIGSCNPRAVRNAIRRQQRHQWLEDLL
jgi:hypothetical protein